MECVGFVGPVSGGLLPGPPLNCGYIFSLHTLWTSYALQILPDYGLCLCTHDSTTHLFYLVPGTHEEDSEEWFLVHILQK